ncbi:MAG: alpha/beta fold hydrolase [Candidatus Obscuribacterales bacterium]
MSRKPKSRPALEKTHSNPLLGLVAIGILLFCSPSLAAQESANDASVANTSVQNAPEQTTSTQAAPAQNATAQDTSRREGNALERIKCVEDGPLSKQLHLPLYEWIPRNAEPDGMVLAIHGLTLHGKRYEVLGRAFAAEGFYVCAPDMRGFGRCYTDEKGEFSVDGESKRRVDYDKSFQDIVALAKAMKSAHPNIPLFVMGESLGTAVAIKLAADQPDLVSGLLLSGPTVQVNPLMFIHPENMLAASWALLIHPRFNMSTSSFVRNLVSNDPDIVQEMLNDPLCRKGLTVAELLKTKRFVRRTLANASKIRVGMPILLIQGSEDKCMVPHAVTRLMGNVRSSDQTARWLYAHGHLLLETAYLRPATLDSIDAWIRDQSPAHVQEMTAIKEEILQVGGKPTRD